MKDSSVFSDVEFPKILENGGLITSTSLFWLTSKVRDEFFLGRYGSRNTTGCQSFISYESRSNESEQDDTRTFENHSMSEILWTNLSRKNQHILFDLRRTLHTSKSTIISLIIAFSTEIQTKQAKKVATDLTCLS